MSNEVPEQKQTSPTPQGQPGKTVPRGDADPAGLGQSPNPAPGGYGCSDPNCKWHAPTPGGFTIAEALGLPGVLPASKLDTRLFMKEDWQLLKDSADAAIAHLQKRLHGAYWACVFLFFGIGLAILNALSWEKAAHKVEAAIQQQQNACLYLEVSADGK